MCRTPHILRAAFLATIAVVCGVAATAPAGAAAAGQTGIFTDPSGDAGIAPDVATVTVANSTAGQIVFQVTLAAPLRPSSSVAIALDTDQYASTGDPTEYGADYRLTDTESTRSVSLSRWDGATWQPVATSATVAGNATNRLVLSIDKRELGVTNAFNFSIGTFDALGGQGTGDHAPDVATYGFQLTTVPPVKLSLVAFQTERVGGGFAAAMLVHRSDTKRFLGSEGGVRCRATIAGRTLRTLLSRFVTVSDGGVKAPVAMCAWALGAKPHGKTIRGTMTVSYAGATLTKSFSSRLK
jgi:hypothetical protein